MDDEESTRRLEGGLERRCSMWEQDPRSGDDVVFMSGQSLGRVNAVRKGEFRVMTGEGPLWLSPDVVFTRNGNCLTLVCEHKGLDRFTPEAASYSLDLQARVRQMTPRLGR